MLEFADISFEEIGFIRDLWEKNRLFHESMSLHFKEKYRSVGFTERMEAFQGAASDGYLITVAKRDESVIGYCLSVISRNVGEIESLHVSEAERGNGIGKSLMDRHIAWMRNSHCQAIGVTVMNENEAAKRFYEREGFQANTVYMQLLGK